MWLAALTDGCRIAAPARTVAEITCDVPVARTGSHPVFALLNTQLS
jgi:hypothetical protein